MHGWTPLHIAAERGNFQICKLIIEKITDDKNPSDDGMTLLDIVVRRGHFQICQLIVKNIAEKYPRSKLPLFELDEEHFLFKVFKNDLCKYIQKIMQNLNKLTNYDALPEDDEVLFKDAKRQGRKHYKRKRQIKSQHNGQWPTEYRILKNNENQKVHHKKPGKTKKHKFMTSHLANLNLNLKVKTCF